jgi:organic radical activating enzyme
LKQKEKFTLQLLLLKKCNQKCGYCDVWEQSSLIRNSLKEYNKTIREKVQTFLGGFKEDIKQKFNNELIISGGEPGLINDLPLIVQDIIDLGFDVKLMSNGLVRKKFPELAADPKVFYNEHLLKDIDPMGKKIKFYNDMDFIDVEEFPNSRNIIVMTRGVCNYFLKPENREELDHIKKFSLFKPIVYKKYSCKGFFEDTLKLAKLTNSYEKLKFFSALPEKYLDQLRLHCFNHTAHWVVDFERYVPEVFRCDMAISKSEFLKGYKGEEMSEAPLCCEDCFAMPFISESNTFSKLI